MTEFNVLFSKRYWFLGKCVRVMLQRHTDQSLEHHLGTCVLRRSPLSVVQNTLIFWVTTHLFENCWNQFSGGGLYRNNMLVGIATKGNDPIFDLIRVGVALSQYVVEWQTYSLLIQCYHPLTVQDCQRIHSYDKNSRSTPGYNPSMNIFPSCQKLFGNSRVG